MKGTKLILSDADGCLLNWNKGFCEFMDSKGYPRFPNTEHEYSIGKRHNIPEDLGYEFLKEYNNSEFMASLEPFADSQVYVPKLAELGFKFTVVTSISSASSARDYRTENLKLHFGDVFDEIHCLDMGEHKFDILFEKWGESGLFWVEDHPRQADAGHSAGLKTVLIDHPYNAYHNAHVYSRVSNHKPWKEIYDLVCLEYGLIEV